MLHQSMKLKLHYGTHLQKVSACWNWFVMLAHLLFLKECVTAACVCKTLNE